MPHAATCTSTSDGPGSGTGNVATARCLYSERRRAFIAPVEPSLNEGILSANFWTDCCPGHANNSGEYTKAHSSSCEADEWTFTVLGGRLFIARSGCRQCF